MRCRHRQRARRRLERRGGAGRRAHHHPHARHGAVAQRVGRHGSDPVRGAAPAAGGGALRRRTVAAARTGGRGRALAALTGPATSREWAAARPVSPRAWVGRLSCGMRRLIPLVAGSGLLLLLSCSATAQQLEPVVTGLRGPVVIANANDDRLFVVEQAGRIRVVVDGALVAEPFLRSEEHTSELQSRENLVCRLLLEKKQT